MKLLSEMLMYLYNFLSVETYSQQRVVFVLPGCIIYNHQPFHYLKNVAGGDHLHFDFLPETAQLECLVIGPLS